MARFAARATPYTTLADQTKHFRVKRDQTVRNLHAHGQLDNSHFLLLTVSPTGVVETYASSAFMEEKGFVESVMGGGMRRKCGEVVKRRQMERKANAERVSLDAKGEEGWVDEPKQAVLGTTEAQESQVAEPRVPVEVARSTIGPTPSIVSSEDVASSPQSTTSPTSAVASASTASASTDIALAPLPTTATPVLTIQSPTLGFGEGNLSWLYPTDSRGSPISLHEDSRGKMAPRTKTSRHPQSSEPKVAGLVGLGISNSSGSVNGGRRKREPSVTTLVGATKEKKSRSKTAMMDQENTDPFLASGPSPSRRPPLGVSGSQGTPMHQAHSLLRQEYHSPSPSSRHRFADASSPYHQSPYQHQHPAYPTQSPHHIQTPTFDHRAHSFDGSSPLASSTSAPAPYPYHYVPPPIQDHIAYPTYSPRMAVPPPHFATANPSAPYQPVSHYAPPPTQPLPQHEFSPTINPDLHSPAFPPIQRTHSAPPIPSPTHRAIPRITPVRRPSHLSMVHMPRAEREAAEAASRGETGPGRETFAWREEMGGFGTPGGGVGLGIRMSGGDVEEGGRFGDEY